MKKKCVHMIILSIIMSLKLLSKTKNIVNLETTFFCLNICQYFMRSLAFYNLIYALI